MSAFLSQSSRTSQPSFMAPSRAILSSSRTVQTGLRRGFSSFPDMVSSPKNLVQSYISTSKDPYLNLSIEHYLLQKSHPDSTILFLYVNRPCIVIGRNQNPWYEVNLGILKAVENAQKKETELSGIGNVDLVRRRSGGGTVFHDEGNVNWSIICPPASFNRDKHAEMVVRALRKQGVTRARVNERHDIVLDQGSEASSSVSPDDAHATPYTLPPGHLPRPLKVSGSAYKLTRTRALHHATCLLQSPNLHIIPTYLHSPAKPFIKAKGVDSVSSPVANIGLSPNLFEKLVQREFVETYGVPELEVVHVGEEHLRISEIKMGYDELKTLDWIYSQTPQFTLSSLSEDGSLALPLSTKHESQLPGLITVSVKHGSIQDFELADDSGDVMKDAAAIPRVKLQDLKKTLEAEGKNNNAVGTWLASTLLVPI